MGIYILNIPSIYLPDKNVCITHSQRRVWSSIVCVCVTSNLIHAGEIGCRLVSDLL